MLKKKGLFGLLLVILLSVVVVEAKEALTVDGFVSKMEELGYETMSYGDAAYAYPKDGSVYDSDEAYAYEKYESAEEAQKDLDEFYDDTEEFDEISRSQVTSGNSSCVTLSGKQDGEYGYFLVCRVDDTIIMGSTTNEDKADTVKDVLKDLGYYSSASWVIFLVLGIVAAIIIAVVVIVVLSSKKKKNNMNGMYPNNGMNYNQPMNNMNQGMNFGQPMDQGMNNNQMMNNMNPAMNFGQPQPMDQGMNNNQMMNNMNPAMNFGQPQPMDQGMNYNQQPANNFNQPVDNMNNNQMNNNFPNMN